MVEDFGEWLKYKEKSKTFFLDKKQKIINLLQHYGCPCLRLEHVVDSNVVSMQRLRDPRIVIIVNPKPLYWNRRKLNSINICWWGWVKAIYHWNANDIWLLLHSTNIPRFFQGKAQSIFDPKRVLGSIL